MYYQSTASVPHYQFELFKAYPQIRHYVATRKGGVSTGQFDSLNIGLGTADERVNILENRRRIAQMMGIADEQLIFPNQQHESNIQVITQEKVTKGQHWLSDHLTCTDALISQEKGICISAISADCVPLLMFDPVRQVIGAVHAGWRGTVKKIAQKTVLQMQELMGCQPADLLIGIGPSIGPERYEVGTTVIEAVEQAFGTKTGLIHHENNEGKGFFDLWEANKRQLLEVGVQADHIEVSGLCTLTHSDTFFSARHFKGKGGRFASGIMLT